MTQKYSTLSYRLAFPRLFLAPCMGTALALSACSGGGASPSTVESRLRSTLPSLVDNAAQSFDALQGGELWTQLSDGLAPIQALTATIASDGSDPGAPPPADDFGDSVDGPSIDGQESADFLITTLFNDANYEGGGDYRLPADLLCPEEIVFDENGNVLDSGAVDPDCAATIDAIEPRIHVETAGDGLDFDLLIGAERAAPIAIELRSDQASVVVDLFEAKRAALIVSSAVGESIELPDVMEGVLSATLRINGPADASIEMAIRSDLQVEGPIGGLGQMRLASAAADPLFALRANGTDAELSAAVDLHRTELSLPWAAMNETSNATGTFALDLQGLSGTLLLSESEQSIVLANLGIGDGTSTIKLDEFTLVSLDLNADAGRRLDMTVIPDSGALPIFGFDPGIDFQMNVDFSPLAAAGDEVPDYLIDQGYRVELSGDAPALQPVEGQDGAPGLAVSAGELRISNTTAPSDIVVAQGSCLLPSPLEAGEHEILGLFSAGSCPQ